MAQIRTKKDKEKAQQLRIKEATKEGRASGVTSYTYSRKDIVKSQGAADTLLKVDSGYIVKDLLKTVTISSLLLCIVIGIYFYLRYN